MDAETPAPDVLFGLPGRAAVLPSTADRQVLFQPAAAEELVNNLLGGAVTADGVVTHFCPKGFYTPITLPGSEPCRRNTVTIPGQPSTGGGLLGQVGRCAALCTARGAGAT